MKANNPTELLYGSLRELHSMEAQLARALPVLSGSVMNLRLRKLLTGRALRARDRRDRLADILDRLGESPGTEECGATKGILTGGNKHLAGVGNPFTRDLVMIGHCMRIEEHAIAAYRGVLRLAERAGFVAEARWLAGFLSELEEAGAPLRSLEAEIFGTAAYQRAAVKPQLMEAAV